MGTVTLRPSTVGVSAFNTFKASVAIGGDSALSDDDDATYDEVWTSVRSSTVGRDLILATFPATSLDIVAATLMARVTYAVSGGAQFYRFNMQVETSTDVLGLFLHEPIEDGSTVPTTGTIYTLTDWTNGVDPVALSTALAAGDLSLNMSALSDGTPPATPPADWMLRVYELALILTTAATGSPPLRRYPRSDGLGVGPTRHYPPPQSRRLAGGIR